MSLLNTALLFSCRVILTNHKKVVKKYITFFVGKKGPKRELNAKDGDGRKW